MSQVHLVLYFIQYLVTDESEMRSTSVSRVALDETSILSRIYLFFFFCACSTKLLVFVALLSLSSTRFLFLFLSHLLLTLIAR